MLKVIRLFANFTPRASPYYCVPIAILPIAALASAASSSNAFSLTSTTTRLISTGKFEWRLVLIGDRRHGVAADVKTLLHREAEGDLLRELSLADHLLAHPKRHLAATADGVLLVDSDLSRKNTLTCGNLVL